MLEVANLEVVYNDVVLVRRQDDGAARYHGHPRHPRR